MSHFIHKCKHGIVIRQCRCSYKDKTVKVVSCPDSCLALVEEAGVIEINTRANLGYATTGELMEELKARFEIQCADAGGLNYRTVDGDKYG